MVRCSVTSYCEPPAAIPDYAAVAPPCHVPPYEEVIVEQ